MKKLCVFLGVLSVLFSGCAVHDWADSVITNNSESRVAFKFNNTNVRTLAIGERAVFETAAYQHMEYYFPDKMVSFTYKATDTGYIGEFNARKSWWVKVDNNHNENVTLSADGWMEVMVDITPGKADDDNHKGKIYTNKPQFSVSTESGAPAVVTYTYNETDETFLVTISGESP